LFVLIKSFDLNYGEARRTPLCNNCHTISLITAEKLFKTPLPPVAPGVLIVLAVSNPVVLLRNHTAPLLNKHVWSWNPIIHQYS